MRTYSLLAATAGLALTVSVVRADFLFLTSRTAATGMFAGDDLVELQVKNDGNNGTGTTLLAATVTFSSIDPNGIFFVRTYDADGTGLHNGSPGSDPADNDMDVSGLGGETPLGTYLRFGSSSQWTLAGSNPDFASSDDGPHPLGPGEPGYPSSGKYTDGQSLSGFTVIGGANLTSGGVSDTSFKPLAFAVVPRGQEVTFDVNVAGATGPAFTGRITYPEPATLGVLAVGAIGSMARRRRA